MGRHSQPESRHTPTKPTHTRAPRHAAPATAKPKRGLPVANPVTRQDPPVQKKTHPLTEELHSANQIKPTESKKKNLITLQAKGKQESAPASPASKSKDARESSMSLSRSLTALAGVFAVIGVILTGLSWGWMPAAIVVGLCAALTVGYFAVYVANQN